MRRARLGRIMVCWRFMKIVVQVQMLASWLKPNVLSEMEMTQKLLYIEV